MIDAQTSTPVFRFEPGTTGRFQNRKITFIRQAVQGHMIEYSPDPEAENIPAIMKGSRPDLEFVGRRIVPHHELTAALMDGTLDIDEGDYVFIDHSQTFKPQFVASLDESPAQDLILRFASVMLMREICQERGILKRTRSEIKGIESVILRKLPGRIAQLSGTIEKLRRHPFRKKSIPIDSATAQTIKRWDEQLRTHGFCNLVDNRHLSGNSTSKLAPEVVEILKAVIDQYETLEKVPKTDVHDKITSKVNAKRQSLLAAIEIREAVGELIEVKEREAVNKVVPPSLKTVSAWIKAISPLESILRKNGSDYMDRNRFIVGMGLNVERAGQIVMIDENDVDLMTIVPYPYLVHFLGEEKLRALGISEAKPLRVIMSVMIDVYTGCILGMQIGMTATPDLAKRTFLMAMSDKTKLAEACGAEGEWNQFLRPEKVMHDSGNAYLAGATEMLCAQLRIDKVSAPKAKAFIRAAVERVFKTVNRGLLAKIPGKTFSNIGERGEYDAEAEAVMTLDDLIQVLTVWIVDIYHNDENGGRDNLTPADLWNHEMRVGIGCRPIPALKNMTHIFGTTFFRRAQTTGIRVMHANYSSKVFARELLRDPNRAFKIRWWEENLSEIQVEIKPRTWIPLEVMDPRARGVNLDEWLLILKREEVERNPDAEATRRSAEQKIDSLIQDRIATRRKVTRKTMTPELLLKTEQRALRYFATPTTMIASAQTHSLYGVPVGGADDEGGAHARGTSAGSGDQNSGAHVKPTDRTAARGRRPKDIFKPGTME
ncbi:hypothetical protein [Sulfitobacter guttiformis]|nr:hypothetical protein [Sulfitobacter guttiformis]KIN72868.1 Transposase [Sulfitobacter guttiformis KCTC 32187]